MKSAREMFEELGFIYEKNEFSIRCHRRTLEEDYSIEFYFFSKKYEIESDYYELCVDIETHKAIQKQLEELHWI